MACHRVTVVAHHEDREHEMNIPDTVARHITADTWERLMQAALVKGDNETAKTAWRMMARARYGN